MNFTAEMAILPIDLAFFALQREFQGRHGDFRGLRPRFQASLVDTRSCLAIAFSLVAKLSLHTSEEIHLERVVNGKQETETVGEC